MSAIALGNDFTSTLTELPKRKTVFSNQPQITSNIYGNVEVNVHALGASAYRIEWKSKMTGATTNLVRHQKGQYLVYKEWAKIRTLPPVSTEFEKAKPALVHFINNVDIHKMPIEQVYEAKKYCLDQFTQREKLHPIVNPNFPRLRLQGAIGKSVQIKSNNGKEVIAIATLLQLTGNKAEVRIDERISYSKPKNIHKFDTKLVYIR